MPFGHAYFRPCHGIIRAFRYIIILFCLTQTSESPAFDNDDRQHPLASRERILY